MQRRIKHCLNLQILSNVTSILPIWVKIRLFKTDIDSEIVYVTGLAEWSTFAPESKALADSHNGLSPIQCPAMIYAAMIYR